MVYLTLFTAIAISAIAAWYSIAGLMAIFASAPIPIAVMGTVLELGKLVTASWLYQNWKHCPLLLKWYLSTAVVILMLITSMGIFGFLSKAHIDQILVTGDNTLEISSIDRRIEIERKRITDSEKVIGQLDEAVDVLSSARRISGPRGAIAVRKNQQEERKQLNTFIDESTSRIVELENEKQALSKQQLELVAEVGPIKYIAEFVYNKKADQEILEKAVRWVIITIIFVFDPLAVLLLIAFNINIKRNRTYKKV